MRRLPSSYNEHNVSDEEIDEVFYGLVQPNVEILLRTRDHGERVLYVGFTTKRIPLVEVGIEDQDGELVVFHAREATGSSVKAYEERTGHGRP